ncbi:hypothetical protein [Azospirillum sp. B4]|uniref:hypothetical protein n=1 Tax=Azospirillum sp. B4 TaxID=95605 RepID=UPI0005CAE27A|nr:hypothetical protein [Azospirillum sp. B4]
MSGDSDYTPVFYTMRLDFDVRQASTALRFNLLRNDGWEPAIQPNAPAAMQTSGIAAGGYQLNKTDGINVVIFAGFEPDSLTQITIKGLTLVALPAPYSTAYRLPTREQPDLSPYVDADYATHRMDEWTRDEDPVYVTSAPDAPSTQWAIFQKKKTETNGISVDVAPASDLPIVAKSGVWQIIGFLSVLIETDAGTTHRVYTFDPDVMVGSGGETHS